MNDGTKIIIAVMVLMGFLIVFGPKDPTPLESQRMNLQRCCTSKKDTLCCDRLDRFDSLYQQTIIETNNNRKNSFK